MYCTNCGKEISEVSKFCKYCGETNIKPRGIKKKKGMEVVWTCDYCEREFDTKKESDLHEKFCQLNPNNIIKSNAKNTSGMGDNSIVPEEIKYWSWPAFLMTWIWAIGHRVWIGLLVLIPYVGLIMAIVLGINGNAWAWKSKKWQSVEQFKKVQKLWFKWWLWLCLIVPLIVTVISIISVAVLSTINPIEQTNKARDSRMQNDCAEMLNAFERFYAVNNKYPWQTTKNSTGIIYEKINSAFWMDEVYSSGELRYDFKEKLSKAGDTYTVYSDGYNLYVCFNPKAETNISFAKENCGAKSDLVMTPMCTSGLEQVCVP